MRTELKLLTGIAALAVMQVLPVAGQEDVPPPFEAPPKVTDLDPFDPDSRDPLDEEPLDPEAPKMIHVQVEYIEMSHEQLTDLMFMRDPKGDATGLRKEVVTNTGNISWLEMKDLVGNTHEILMPAFYSNRISTGLSMYDGQYTFAGVLTPKGEDGEADFDRKIMIFVKADVVQIKK